MSPKKEILIDGWKYDVGDCIVRIGNFRWPGSADFHTVLEVESVGKLGASEGAIEISYAEIAATLGFPAVVRRLYANAEALRNLNAGMTSRPGLDENILQYVELMKHFF